MIMEGLEKYRKAGRIAVDVRKFGEPLVRPGARIIDIAEKIEKKIMELGGKPAFPVNISSNENAAHDTADINDMRVIGEGDIVKLDFGVHVDGYIVDTAATVCLNKDFSDMHKVSQLALEEALKLFKPGGTIKEVSEVIEKTIREGGFNPISNLTGHGLERYDLHARMEVPNVKTNIDYTLKEGDVFSVEPFVTNGGGYVIEGASALIYGYQHDGRIRFREGTKILELAKTKFDSLPFAGRWLSGSIPAIKLKIALNQLSQIGALHSYAVLRERENGIVVQSEHSVIVGDKPEILTL